MSVLVTERGRPVTRLVPLDDRPGARDTDGSVTLLADENELYFSTGLVSKDASLHDFARATRELRVVW